MNIRRVGQVPRNERGAGQTAHLLLGLPGDTAPMSITLVDAEPGSRQAPHEHPDSTQVYLVIAGAGRMLVGGEEADVDAGTMICIPPGTSHAIHNTGTQRLTYVSATTPPFPVEADTTTWRLA
jgi:mannose-6-phosphate isomerase-like protein (cupin superfamily)